MRPLLPVLLLVLAWPAAAEVTIPPGVDLEDGIDADAVLRAVRRDELMPLDRVLAILRSERDGEVVEIELDMEDGRIIYDFDVLSPQGRLYAVAIDAATGRVLEIEVEEEDYDDYDYDYDDE